MSSDGGNGEIFISKEKGVGKRKKRKKKSAVNSFTDRADNNPLEKFAKEIADIDLEQRDQKTAGKDDVTVTAGKRSELIKASEDGYITAKVEYLKKCGTKAINKKYEEFLTKRKKEADMFLTDLIISQFSSTLGGLDAIDDPKELADELRNNDLLKKDVERAVGLISPYVPLIGLLSGIAITGKHVYHHKIAEKTENPDSKD